MTDTGRTAPSTAKVLAAFAAVYLAWGSTYLAIRVAIDSLPPLSMAGVRFLAAGAVLYAALRLRGEPAPTGRQWRATAVGGALLLLCGNGSVVMAERTVPSGVVALLVAVVPLWMVLLDWWRPGGTRPSARTMAGLVVGFGGILLLIGPGSLAEAGGVDPLAAAGVMGGSFAWAAGSIHARGAALPRSPFLAAGMQMTAGGILLLGAGALAGEWGQMDPSAFTARSLAALAYLVVIGSLVGFTAYLWLLGVTTAARVSTYAYVNPVVAVFLGWALLGEPVTARVLLAAATIVAAVAVITRRRGPPRPGDAAAGPGDASAPDRRPRRMRRAA